MLARPALHFPPSPGRASASHWKTAISPTDFTQTIPPPPTGRKGFRQPQPGVADAPATLDPLQGRLSSRRISLTRREKGQQIGVKFVLVGRAHSVRRA